MNNNISINNIAGDVAYEIWRKRTVIVDCLSSLGKKCLSKKLMKSPLNIHTHDKYLSIIKNIANKTNRHDVLERLYFAGLIYGTGGL